jgi:uncharacterized protein with FMN-binding domain
MIASDSEPAAGPASVNPEKPTSGKLTTNNLMMIGSAAVIGVYAAGYFKTKAAADRFVADADHRRPPPPEAAANEQVRTVERMTTPSVNGGATLLRAGAVAAVPPVPALARASDKPKSSDKPSSGNPSSGKPKSTGKTATPTAIEATVATAAAVAPADTAPATTSTLISGKPAESDAPQPPKHVPWKDGTYYGWGTSRHGDIQAAVVIQGGHIINAAISQCLTRYSCSWIAALPPQVVGRQSAEVDYVSGATQSVNAFYYAILEALNQAK